MSASELRYPLQQTWWDVGRRCAKGWVTGADGVPVTCELPGEFADRESLTQSEIEQLTVMRWPMLRVNQPNPQHGD